MQYGPGSGRVVETAIRYFGAQNAQNAQGFVTFRNAWLRDEPGALGWVAVRGPLVRLLPLPES
jgi:hypothetical protein